MSDLVTVVFGGPSPEHEISILTGLQCERVLARKGVAVQCLYWDAGGLWHLVPANTEARDYLDGAPKQSARLEIRLGGNEDGFYKKGGLRASRIDVGTVLSCLHGGMGESGGAQALFQLLAVPATGGTIAAAALGMDKLAFGAVMAGAQIPTLPRELLEKDREPGFAGPYIVKPRFGGSSIGIEVCDDHATAVALLGASRFLRQGAVVEPFRRDLFDLNLGFVTYPEFRPSLLERPTGTSAGSIFSFDQKYLHTDGLAAAPREIPAQVPDELRDRAVALARRVALVTGLTGIVRIDFLTDGRDLFVNEVNSIPGAMGLYLWPDTDPAELLLNAVNEAKANPGWNTPSGFSDGAALRAAGGIAGKLSQMGPAR